MLREDEETLDKQVYVGDENEYIQGLIEQMKKEGKIGEDMLKKRIDRQHKKAPEQFKDLDTGAASVMSNMQQVNHEFKQRRLELASSSDINKTQEQ